MEIKECQAIKTLSFTTQTTFVEMQNLVIGKAREIYQEAVNKGLDICGPVYWIYTGADGNPQTRFQLQIAVPVNIEMEFAGELVCKNLPDFKFVKYTHYGKWENFGEAYCKVFAFIADSGFKYSGTCREVYIHIDLENPDNHITEIQVGIN